MVFSALTQLRLRELRSLVTSHAKVIIIYGKRLNPRMDPALVVDFKGQYLKNGDFSKITSKPCPERQILSLEINLLKHCK